MRLGKEKRSSLGTSLGRRGEYFLTVTLVGEIISGEISMPLRGTKENETRKIRNTE